MIGKTGMTQAFKGHIKVVCCGVKDGRADEKDMIRNIDTKDILAINQDKKQPNYTNIVVFNSEKDKIPNVYMATNKFASKQDIIAAYTAAKDACIDIEAINI